MAHDIHIYGTSDNMDQQANVQNFIDDLANYIGGDFLSQSGITINHDTRFSDLRFDLVDEVIIERMVQDHFGLPNWFCDDWPETIGELLTLISKK